MSDVHWQRGSLRAWIVASAVWISYVGWANYEAFFPPYDPPPPPGAMVMMTPVQSSHMQRINGKLKDGTLFTIQVPDGWTPQQAQAEAQGQHDYEVQRQEQQARAKISHALEVALLPPLSLLIAGFVIRWIIRGFLPVHPTL